LKSFVYLTINPVSSQFLSACCIPSRHCCAKAILGIVASTSFIMDRFGHQLMAVNVDNQLLTLLGGYLHGIMEKFAGTSGISNSYISSFKTELNAVTEAAYYLASFSLDDNTRASPGMRSVGLEVPQESATTLAVLVCSYIAVKWSALKLSALSVSQGAPLRVLLLDSLVVTYCTTFCFHCRVAEPARGNVQHPVSAFAGTAVQLTRSFSPSRLRWRGGSMTF
jgi:hypothetical protein